MKYFRFFYIQNDNNINENIVKLNQYCNFLSNMYEYYFKPVKTGKITFLKIIFYEDEDLTYYTYDGTFKDIYIKYNHKDLFDKSVEDIQKILFENIHNNIINYVMENNWQKENFENVYKKIVEKKYIFEEKYLKPVSNKIYKAQIMFKHDYQKDGTFLEIYKNKTLENKIQFSHSALVALNKDIKSMEWIDENRIKIINRKHYWEINVNGLVEHKNEHENNPQELYDIGKYRDE